MGCQPCEERKQRLAAAVADGPPLPACDWAFYGAVALDLLLIGFVFWLSRKEARA